MKEFLQILLNVPLVAFQRDCCLWLPEPMGLYQIADGLIAIAFYLIPVTLIYLGWKRQDLPFNQGVLPLSIFILACGTTALVDGWMLEHPVYWLSGALKLITATISLYTAAILISLLFKNPTPSGLAATNQTLETEITERQKTETALRESEERFRSTFEQAFVGIAHVALSGAFLRLNQRFCDIVGYTQAELQTLTFQEITHPDDLATDLQLVDDLLNLRISTYSLEKRYICKDRSLVWIDLTVSLVRDRSGEPKYFISAIADISDRKSIELALRQSEETLRLFVKYAPAGIAMLNANLCYIFASQRWVDDYKLVSVESIIGRSHYDVFPEVPERWRHIHQRCLAGAIERGEEDFFGPVDGSHQWIRWEVRPWYTANQTIGGIVIFSEDITDHKQAGINLQLSEERLRLALAATNQGIYDLNVQTGDVVVTPSYAAMLGYDPAEFQESAGQWVARLHPDDREHASRRYQDYVAGNIPEYRSEFRLKTSSGDWKWILSLGKLVAWDEDGQPLRMLGTHTDISDRKQAEAERLQAEKLRTELKLLEDILEVILAGYWDWDIPNHLEYLSPTFKRMFGYDDHELPNVPETWQQMIFTEDLPGILECFNQHVKSRGQIPYYGEVRYHHKDGSTVWVIYSGRVIEWGKDGQPLRMIGCHINITERKLAEAQLQTSEAELRALFAAMTDTVIVRDRSGQCLKVAPNSSSLYREPPEMLGKTLHEVLPRREADLILAKIHECLDQQTTTSAEYCLSIHGQPVYFLASISPLSADAVIIVARDISARKQAEQALQELSTAMQNAIEGISQIDINGRYIAVNRSYANACGYKPEELLGQPWQQIVYSDDVPALNVAYQQMLQVGKVEVEARGLRKDGAMFFMQVTMVVTHDDGGTVIGHHCFMKDITDRKQAEDALANYAREVEDLYNNAPCGYHSLDADGRFVNVNETELQWFGYTRAEVLGQPFVNFVTEAGRLEFPKNYSRFKQQGWIKDLEYDVICKDGTLFPVLLNAIAVKSNDGKYLYNRATLYDNRDRKQAEEQLRISNERTSLANAELARAARLKDEFLAGMSHELRTPLNAILGLSEALLEEVYGDLTPDQQHSLQTIEKSGQHLLALINDILDLSKIESGKMDLELSTVGVRSLCESSLTFVKQQANHKQIKLNCQIADGVSDLKADERRLRQVLVNLLSNAVKFTPEKGSVHLQVRADPVGEMVEFHIKDTGIGIAPENMNRLFQPFVQLDSSLSRRYEGTGLGLSLVRRIMDLHGGSISVDSQIGRGSCFTVTLPWNSTPPEINPAPQSYGLEPTPPEIERALIVEDSEAAASQIARYLTEFGAKGIVYCQGKGALDIALQSQPDVIILDILLPGESGWEVLTALKTNPATRAIPVIMASVVDARSRGLELGAAEYLLKPITRQQLQHALNQALSIAQPSPQTDLAFTSSFAPTPPVILLVEDNEANITTTTLYLQAYGLNVVVARNGLEAIQMAKEYQPAVILMDIQMPEMDGLEATRYIRSDAELSHIPIIALTALAMPGDRERCLSVGANEYMVKPVSLKQLLHLIASYVPVFRSGT